MFDDKANNKLSLYMLAPIGWLLFYLTTIVEYRALIKSIQGMLTKQQLTWQRWQREGVLGSQTKKAILVNKITTSKHQ